MFLVLLDVLVFERDDSSKDDEDAAVEQEVELEPAPEGAAADMAPETEVEFIQEVDIIPVASKVL